MLPCSTYCAMNVWFVAFADQKTGKALPEVMEADRPEPMPLGEMSVRQACPSGSLGAIDVRRIVRSSKRTGRRL